MKKLFAICLVAISLSASANDNTITISTSRSGGWSSTAMLPTWCQKFGLDVKVIPVDSKASVGTVRAAQGRGDIDIIGSGVSAAIIAAASGSDNYVIANLSVGGAFLAANKDIQSIDRLKGKRVGVLRNTGMEAMFLMALDKKGLTYVGKTPDVVIINLPPAAAEAAFLAGEVDAFVGIFPENSKTLATDANIIETYDFYRSLVATGALSKDKEKKFQECFKDMYAALNAKKNSEIVRSAALAGVTFPTDSKYSYKFVSVYPDTAINEYVSFLKRNGKIPEDFNVSSEFNRTKHLK